MSMSKPSGMIDFASTLKAVKSETPDISGVVKLAGQVESKAFEENILSPKGQVREPAPPSQSAKPNAAVKSKNKGAQSTQSEPLRVGSLRLSDDEWQYLKEVADEQSNTTSRILRSIVKEWIASKKSK